MSAVILHAERLAAKKEMPGNSKINQITVHHPVNDLTEIFFISRRPIVSASMIEESFFRVHRHAHLNK